VITIRPFRPTDQAAARVVIEEELDGKVVGTTGLIVAGQVGRLVRVAVAQDHRRAGMASALLKRVTAFAARSGVAELVAYTQPEWPDATAFYRSHAFTPFGRDEIDIHLRRIVEPDGLDDVRTPVKAEA
jgi:N-acetylglutamate synthase-like GNAT family acetyltransferase